MDRKKEEKYKNAILYFAKHLNPYQLGKTKLAKLLYYLDFISYRDREKNVTGTLYYKQEFGPLAKDLTEMISSLVAENKLELKRVAINSEEKQRDEFHVLKDPDLNVFDNYEQSLLRKLSNKYANVGTNTIVSKSHLEAPWVKAKNGTRLDYKFAFDIEDFDEGAEEESRQEDKKITAAIERELIKKS